MRNPPINGPEAGSELKQLYSEYTEGNRLAAGMLAQKGIASPEFAEAARTAGALHRRINEFFSGTDQHEDQRESSRETAGGKVNTICYTIPSPSRLMM